MFSRCVNCLCCRHHKSGHNSFYNLQPCVRVPIPYSSAANWWKFNIDKMTAVTLWKFNINKITAVLFNRISILMKIKRRARCCMCAAIRRAHWKLDFQTSRRRKAERVKRHAPPAGVSFPCGARNVLFCWRCLSISLRGAVNQPLNPQRRRRRSRYKNKNTGSLIPRHFAPPSPRRYPVWSKGEWKSGEGRSNGRTSLLRE